jgi:type I restriction enzyme S subunit
MIDNNMPKNWTRVSIEEVCNQKDGLRRGPFGSAIKKEFFVPDGYKVYEQSHAIYNDVNRGKYFISKSKFNELVNFAVQDGDFIVSCSGTLGKIALIPKGAKPGIINQALLRIRTKPEVVSSNYFLYFFRSELFQRLIFDQSQGTAMNNLIGIKDFKLLEFPLPPLPEQHRIVAKIEELFSELDKGIETLKTAKQQLKVYRQAVLKYAFEGRLTISDVKDGELPEGWVVKKLGEIFKTTSGGTPSRKVDAYFTGNTPWVKSGELDHHTIYSAEENISNEAVENSSAKIFPIGTLLIALYGATIGKLSFLGIEAATNQAICAIFPSKEVKLDYMFHYLTLNKRKLIESAVGGAQPNISQTILKDLEVFFPVSLEEQNKIISEIESRLSVCDKIEESIEQGLQQAEALRQSILKKAFEGKLVPQDPNDEPASVLLERIKAERADKQPEKKSIKKK